LKKNIKKTKCITFLLMLIPYGKSMSSRGCHFYWC